MTDNKTKKKTKKKTTKKPDMEGSGNEGCYSNLSDEDEFPCIKLVTHSDIFHLDEVMATGFAKYIWGDERVVVTRTRVPEEIEKGDIVLDVGLVYDPSRHRYDHHQRGFTETLDEKHGIPLSSCGLFIKHFYKELLDKFLNEEFTNKSSRVDIHELMVYLYDTLWEAIDAKDNGISYAYLKKTEEKSVFANSGETYESDSEDNDSSEVRQPVSCNSAGPYSIEYNYWDNLDLGSVIRSMNGDDAYNHSEQLTNFTNASQMAWMIMKQLMIGKVKRFLLMKEADELTSQAMKTRFDFHSSGQILCYESDNYLSASAIKRYEKEHKDEFPDHNSKIKFIVYPISSGDYRVGTIQGVNYTKRMPLLPENKMRENMSSELASDIVFVHARGLFVGGAKTLETAKAMAICSYEVQIDGKKE